MCLVPPTGGGWGGQGSLAEGKVGPRLQSPADEMQPQQ